jgi:hypothetical protein
MVAVAEDVVVAGSVLVVFIGLSLRWSVGSSGEN